MYYFDSFGVETPPLVLEEYVDLVSNERIQQYDESYGGAYCLYMIYLIDRGLRINNALNILVNQCKYPGIYNECFCLVCSKDLRSSFANNVNVYDNVIDNDIVNDNVNVKDNDNVKDNVNDNDNDNDNVNDNVMIIILIYLMINFKGVNITTKNICEQTPSVVNQAVSPICKAVILIHVVAT